VVHVRKFVKAGNVKSKVARCAAVAAAMAVLGLTTACGGGADKGAEPAKKDTTTGSTRADDDAKVTGKPDDRPKASADGGTDRALTEAQLTKAAVEDGEVKGYQVKKTAASDISLDSVPADPAACQPIADMFLFTTSPAAQAGVGRSFSAKDDLDASVTSLALLSYDSEGAGEVLAGLRKATGACTAYEHTGYHYSAVKALKDPGLGDESVAYRLRGSIEGATVPSTFTVVRVGTVVVSFTSMNMLDADKMKIPSAIIDAQLAKVKKATA
jgi:hypothetical protein